MDFCGLFENLLEYVRRMEAIRLSGDKVKPHNQVKKNWLCGLKVVLTATKMYVRKLRIFRIKVLSTGYRQPIYSEW